MGSIPTSGTNSTNDAHGRKKRTKNWYIEYAVGGRTVREATTYAKRSDAIEFLKKRVSEAMNGKIVLSKQVTFDDLRDLIVNDYRNNGRKSLAHLEQVRLPKLADVFAGTKAIHISTAAVERYKSLRLKDSGAPATLNRELAALKRMYRLGLRHGLVATMPYISLLIEHNVRKGFFELDQFRAILRHLPAEYHALFEIASITGWRIRSELLTRQWRHVEFGDKGWLRLEPGEAKDATAGREFQFTTSIYRRYSIVDQAMLDVGASKLDQLQQAQGLSKPVVVSIKRKRLLEAEYLRMWSDGIGL